MRKIKSKRFILKPPKIPSDQPIYFVADPTVAYLLQIYREEYFKQEIKRQQEAIALNNLRVNFQAALRRLTNG